MPVDNATRKRNRRIQSKSIERNGFVVENPCDRCFSSGRPCIMDSKSRNCASCTKHGKKCSQRFHGEAEWNRLLRDQERFDAEIAAAEKEQLELQRQQIEMVFRIQKQQSDVMAKIIRLRKQRQLLRKRNDRMLDHDTMVMDQLDEENPLSSEDFAELDRLAEADDAQILAATSENPTLTQMFGPLSPSVLEGMDLSFLAGDSSGFGISSHSVAQESVSPPGNTSVPAGGSPSSSR